MRPDSSPLVFTILLLLISVIVFLAAVRWEPLETLFAFASKNHRVPRPDVRVWANKQRGHYYCPDSKLYGAIGRYMSQEEALQTGYRPTAEAYCQ